MAIATAAGTYKFVGDVTFNPGSIDDGNAEEVTATVPGVQVGDIVFVNKDTDDNVYAVAAWVSATDQITVAFFNPSGGTVNPASQTVRVIVF